MKKTKIIPLLALSMFLCSSCGSTGVSQEEYNAVVAERNELQEKNYEVVESEEQVETQNEELSISEETTENNLIKSQEYQINDNEKITLGMFEKEQDISIYVSSVNENESNTSLVLTFFYGLFKDTDVKDYSINVKVGNDSNKYITVMFDNGSANIMSYNSSGELIFDYPEWFNSDMTKELSDEYVKEYYAKLEDIKNDFFANIDITEDKINGLENEETQTIETTVEALTETVEATTEIETQIELTEEEYKQNCQELFYDDVFFGDVNLENQYVKLHLFLTESQFFTADAMMYSDTWSQYNEKYNLKRDLFKASVLRKDEDSYFGKGSIQVWFSENFDLDANDYEEGQKITVYAEVISWGNVTWDGYNTVTIIPKYIENNE